MNIRLFFRLSSVSFITGMADPNIFGQEKNNLKYLLQIQSKFNL